MDVIPIADIYAVVNARGRWYICNKQRFENGFFCLHISDFFLCDISIIGMFAV
jgi:hypothetical protein